MTKRPDIQILRGVAVLSVMLAHFGGLIPGGFIGVDIFFVISGFVIALSLERSRTRSNSIRKFLGSFFARRFFRLVPALVTVVVTTLFASVLLLPPRDFLVQAEMSVWSVFFMGNIGAALLDSGGYFAEEVRTNWLLHLWSLGVEEQFYLIFPFGFILLQKFRKRFGSAQAASLLAIIGVLAFLPAMLDEQGPLQTLWQNFFVSPRFDAVFGYYSPVTRAWQFIAGVLAAQLLFSRDAFAPPSKRKWQNSLFFLLIFAIVVFPESEAHPGPAVLVPTLFVFTLLLNPMSDGFARSTFLKPLHWLGDRSYSAYLWHWPVWGTISMSNFGNLAQICFSFLLTFLLSWVTHKYVEQSTYFGNGRINYPVSPTGGVARKLASAALVIAISFIPFLGHTSRHLIEFRINELNLEKPEVPRFQEAYDCLQLDCKELGVNALLVGDSHAGALFNELRAELLQQEISLGAVIVPGCFHLSGIEVFYPDSTCTEREAGLARAVENVDPGWIFVHGYTAGRLSLVNSGRIAPIQIQRRDGVQVGPSNEAETYNLAATEFLERYQQQGRQIVFISSLPDYLDDLSYPSIDGVPATTWQVVFLPDLEYELGSTVSLREFKQRHGGFEKVDLSLARSPNVLQVSGWAAVCAETSCRQRDENGAFIFADTDHLSRLGAANLAQDVGRAVRLYLLSNNPASDD